MKCDFIEFDSRRKITTSELVIIIIKSQSVTMSDLQKAEQFELESLSDLIRLIVSRIDRGNRTGYLYYSNVNNKHLFLSSQVIPGWFDLRGLPMTLKVEADDPGDATFVQYKFATEFDEESWKFTTFMTTDTKVAHIPIIHVKEFPEYMI